MFISFNSFGIYMFRVFSIFVNMGRKRGGEGQKRQPPIVGAVQCTSILMGSSFKIEPYLKIFFLEI